MARRGSDKVNTFLLGGYNLLGTLTSFNDTREAILERSDTLGDTFEEHLPVGVRRAELTQEGFYDDDQVNGHYAITTGPGVSRILVYGWDGTATGAFFTGWASAVEVTYTEAAARNELHKARASYRTAGPVEVGRVIHSYANPAATGKSNVLDNGASSTGLAAYFAYNATVGEMNVRLRHSASAGATVGAILFTFTKTDATAAVAGADRQVTTAAVERYRWFEISTATATGSLANFRYFGGIVNGLTSAP